MVMATVLLFPKSQVGRGGKHFLWDSIPQIRIFRQIIYVISNNFDLQ